MPVERASLFVGCFIRIRIRELFFLHVVHGTTRLHCHRSSDTTPAWPEPIAILGYRSVSIPYLLLHIIYLDWQGVECSKMALVRHPDSDATVILNGSNSVFPSSNGCTWMGSTLASDRRYCGEAFPLTFAILACDPSALALSPCDRRMQLLLRLWEQTDNCPMLIQSTLFLFNLQTIHYLLKLNK